MPNNGPDHKPHPRPGPNPLILASVAAGGFVVLLVVIIYLSNLLDDVGERLSFTPPAAQSSGIGIDISQSQTVYVPIYSHIYSKGGDPFLLEATLSIRNSDPQRSIDISSVSYYNTKGELVEKFLQGPLTLGPLETTAFLVEKSDTRGGSGANFIVAWRSDQPVYEPIIEAVMIGTAKGYGFAFKSIGRPLLERAEQSAKAE